MVKKIAETHPDMVAFKAASEKHEQLRQQLKKTEVKLDEAQAKYAREMARSAQERIDDQASALLANGHLEVITRDDIERLQNECSAYKAAIKKQEEFINTARTKVSKLLHTANRDIYLRMEKRLARAVEELAEANEEEAMFFSELSDIGCTSISFAKCRPCLKSVNLSTIE